MRDYIKEWHGLDFSEPEKIVLVGNSITTDILFGNLNNMVTVWITKLKDLSFA